MQHILYFMISVPSSAKELKHRGYQMSLELILNSLNELNKSILCMEGHLVSSSTSKASKAITFTVKCWCDVKPKTNLDVLCNHKSLQAVKKERVCSMLE